MFFRMRRALAALLGVVGVSLAGAARAEPPSRVNLEITGRVLAHRMGELPTFKVPDEGGETNFRLLPDGARLPARGSLYTFGGGFDVSWLFGERFRLHMVGVDILAAVGPQQRVLSSADGSIATLRPWTAMRYDIGLLGFGLRGKHRRFAWGAGLRTGFAYTTMAATVAEGARSEALSKGVFAASFLLRGDIEGCRRLDPTRRVCVVLTPSLYDYGWGNGISMGLRWEADL